MSLHFGLGFALTLISMMFYVGVGALFYQLFEPVNGTLALDGAFYTLVRIGIWACARFARAARSANRKPVFDLFDATQLHACSGAVSCQREHSGLQHRLRFRGCFWIAIGCLRFRSTFLPPIIGLFALAGLTYLTFLSLANLSLLFEVGTFSGIAEPSMVLWLSIADVIAQRWIERPDGGWGTSASGSPLLGRV